MNFNKYVGDGSVQFSSVLFGAVLGALALASGLGASSANADQPPSCKKPILNLSRDSRANLLDFFSNAFNHTSVLSRKEHDRMFIDRDAKGNIIRNDRRDDRPADKVEPWAHKDLAKDGIPGTSTEKAYRELNLIDKGAPIVVAVIDGGVDIQHEDLQGRIWINEKEVFGKPGTENDGGGYTSDIHGWNFLGGKDGRSINWTNLEVTREVRRMRKLKQTTGLSQDQQKYLDKIEVDYLAGLKDAQDRFNLRTKSSQELQTALETLRAACKTTLDTVEEIKAIESADPVIIAAKAMALKYLEQGWNVEKFKASIEYWGNVKNFYFNLDFDPSGIVGDNPDVMDEIGYGNGNVMPVAADEEHATHVSGIIGAVRGNGIGMDGQASNVRIMSLRAVPNGDERDKDIGNAIRYAADHGARVINMSFGKPLSPNRDYVWKMMKYAASKNVLMVHAAGNDSKDNDKNTFYPNRIVTNDAGQPVEMIDDFMEVGASTKNGDSHLAAEFSDYGQTSVDLFAPGAQIYSTIPGNKYAEFDGTSMATPEVAGVAALVLSQYPSLTNKQVKDILMGSAQRFPGLSVVVPGSDPKSPIMALFNQLSVTGGVLNAYEALKAAAQLVSQ